MSNFAIDSKEIPFGTIIDSRYLIQKVLGQGGLGRTYLGLDTHRFNEPCVLKEFAPLGSGQYDLEKSRNLFRREARILHQITHPQIPKFLACFEGKGRLFLVQEYVKGKTYSQLLQERQQQGYVFSEVEVGRWLMNMLPILTYIHQRGIIHRDISPDNIMQPQEKELPVLIDFGVGKLTNLGYTEPENHTDNHSHSFVGKMSFVGKIGYAPREQISMGRCSPSSDLYALGVTAIVLLTGKMPTLLLDRYTLEWQWRKYAQTSRRFSQIIDKMIEDRPMQRYQIAEEIIFSLRELRRNEEDISTPDLTAVTDAHFYQKIPLFKGKSINKTAKNPAPNLLLSSEEETLINHPSYSSGADVEWLDYDTQAASLSQSKKVKAKSVKPIAKSIFQQDRQPQAQFSEDTVSVNTSLSPWQFDRAKQNRSAFSSASKYPERLHQDLVKSDYNQSEPRMSERHHTHQVIETKFIKFCQEELAYIIGPMASLIVEEVFAQYAPSSPDELVDALAEQIPSRKKAMVFKQRLSESF